MKQRKLVIDSVRVEHRYFCSSRKRLTLETGCYTVTAFQENARFQWLPFYSRAVKAAGFLRTVYQDVIGSAGEERGLTYHINK